MAWRPSPLSVHGYILFEVVNDAERFPAAKGSIFERLAFGAFKAKIDKVFPLSGIVETHRYMQSNSQIGKLVVTT